MNLYRYCVYLPAAVTKWPPIGTALCSYATLSENSERLQTEHWRVLRGVGRSGHSRLDGLEGKYWRGGARRGTR